jgi:DNA-binding response OmpR family regulator
VTGIGILVVEDDERIGESLTQVLESQGYSVTWTRTGADALECDLDKIAIVILDLGLPDCDGVEVCRELRRRGATVPILILTARSDEVDVVVGLDAGADDYIVKPFSLAELLARVRAGARRDVRPDRIVIGELDVGFDTRRVFLRETPIELSVKEFDLLMMLARHAGDVVRRTDLLSSIWDEHWFGSTKTLDTHVWLLRRKLDNPGEPSWITTVRGVGYRLEAP